MNLTIILAITFIFLIVLSLGAFFVFRTLKSTDPKNTDTSLTTSTTNVQSFLPFKEISKNMIDLGNHQYRAIVECSSTNYNLKTQREKEIIEASFQRFVNSLTHPIWFFIQTRIIDNSKMINELKTELQEAVDANPNLEDYANEYINEMINLNESIGNNKQKKKYIIVPYDEAINLPDLDESEKREYSQKEGIQRAYVVANELSSVGVKCRILNTEEIYELIYSCYHKDNHSNAEHLASGELTEMIVSGENREQAMSNDMRVDSILYEAQMKISNEIVGRIQNPEMKVDYEDIIKELSKLRDESGAYYKERRQ